MRTLQLFNDSARKGLQTMLTTRFTALLACAFLLAACPGEPSPSSGTAETAEADVDSEAEREIVRVAAYNIWELGRDKLDHRDADGQFGSHPQLRSAAEVIQRVRPQILLLNEIDFDEARTVAPDFIERYLRVGQNGQEPIDYPHLFFEPTNTGVPSGLDLNNDGASDGPDDAYGFGRYPGQYGMALLSQFPIRDQDARTFRELLWQQMPGNLMPDGNGGRPAFYSPAAREIFRLSSKSHWDVPIEVRGKVLHILAAHPTPPVFDGDEDRNGRRNHDEIRLFADYLTGGEAASYIVDDRGVAGGFPSDASFVLLGDLNADIYSDQEPPTGQPAIAQLLDHPRVQDPRQKGSGELAEERPYAGPKELRTAPYGRIDYALPSRDLEVQDGGVFWPASDDPLYRLVSGEERGSDHMLVWVDLAL